MLMYFVSAVNGRSQIVSTKNLSVEDTQKHLDNLRTSTGRKPERLKKPWKTDQPSIQGNWHPFMFKP